MKAAVLNAFGEELVIEFLPDPVLGTGEVTVDVAAAGVANYTGGVLSGARNYLLEPPVVPGPGGRRLPRSSLFQPSSILKIGELDMRQREGELLAESRR